LLVSLVGRVESSATDLAHQTAGGAAAGKHVPGEDLGIVFAAHMPLPIIDRLSTRIEPRNPGGLSCPISLPLPRTRSYVLQHITPPMCCVWLCAVADRCRAFVLLFAMPAGETQHIIVRVRYRLARLCHPGPKNLGSWRLFGSDAAFGGDSHTWRGFRGQAARERRSRGDVRQGQVSATQRTARLSQPVPIMCCSLPIDFELSRGIQALGAPTAHNQTQNITPVVHTRSVPWTAALSSTAVARVTTSPEPGVGRLRPARRARRPIFPSGAPVVRGSDRVCTTPVMCCST
jgi:hypothetical protein